MNNPNPNFSSNEASRPGTGPDGAEVVTQIARGVHGDNETAPDAVDDHVAEVRGVPAGLPIWLAEKFHWKTRNDGTPYLDPNPEYMAAVFKDAPKFVEYGNRCLIDKEGTILKSTEAGIAAALAKSFLESRQSLEALDASGRESRALTKIILDRVMTNAISAASTQFEIDNWAARAAQSNKDASEHPGFSDKLSRRDGFAHAAAVWMHVYRNVFPEIPVAADAYVKAAKQSIYQQARIRGSELLSPAAPQAQQQHARAAAVLASRPFE